MAGDTIAKLQAVIELNDKNSSNKIKEFGKVCQGADKQLEKLKTDVANSTTSFNNAKIAYVNYTNELKKGVKVTDEQRAKQQALKQVMQQQQAALLESRAALQAYNAQAAAAGGLLTRLGGLFTALSVAILATAAASIKNAAEFERTNIALEVLTGSLAAAKKLYSDLEALAIKTPFEVTDLLNASKTLLAFGVPLKMITKDITMLTNVAGGNKEALASLTLAFGQVAAAGRLTGQDLLQFVNAGFSPLQEISERTGISMGELKKKMEQGAISVDMLRFAFQSATEKGGRFYQMNEKQSQTVIGLWSTLIEKINKASIAFGQFFEPLTKGTLSALIKGLDATANAFERITASQQKAAKFSDISKLDAEIAATKKRAESVRDLDAAYNQQINRLKQLQAQRQKLITQSKTDTDRPKRAINTKLREQILSSGGTKAGKATSTSGTSAPAGKSQEQIISERANLLTSLTNLEIAKNKMSDEQVLAKKINTQKQILALYKKGSIDYINEQTRLLELENDLEKTKLDNKIKSVKTASELEIADKKAFQEASALELLELEIRTQQNILNIKRKGVSDINKLSEEEKNSYTQTQLDIFRLQEQRADMIQQMQEQDAEKIKNLSTNVSDYVGGMVDRFSQGSTSIKQEFQSLLYSISRQIITSNISKLLTNLLTPKQNTGAMLASAAAGGVSKAGTFSKILSAGSKLLGFANGGMPDPNKPFIAGENGPELIQPLGTNAKVFNNAQTANKLGGDGITPIIVNTNFSIKTLDGREASRVIMDNAPAIQKVVREAIKFNQGDVRNVIKQV